MTLSQNKLINPPYEITARILSLISEICERVGQTENILFEPKSIQLRRSDRLKTVQASLQIEGNTLSLEQVTAVSEGRKVIGAPSEVQEVRNALAAYENQLFL